MLSKRLETVINNGFKLAKFNHHEFMTTEHLLLCLLDDPVAANILVECGADIETLRKQVQECTDKSAQSSLTDSDREPQPTLEFQRILQRSVFSVQTSGGKEITGGHVLVALLNEKESEAAVILRCQNVVGDKVKDLVGNVQSDAEQREYGIGTLSAGALAVFDEELYRKLKAQYENQDRQITEMECEIENLKNDMADVNLKIEEILSRK